MLTTLPHQLGDYMGGLTKEGSPIVGNLITSDFIVKPHMLNLQSFIERIGLQICPTRIDL